MTVTREKVTAVLNGLGLTAEPEKYSDGIHSWRCEYPDRYGRCDCFKLAVDAIIRAFAAERSELLRNVDLERLATLEWATAERREAIAEVRRALARSMEAVRAERAVVVDDLRRIVDAVLLRVAIFLVAAVVLAPLVAHAYARVWPRRLR